MPAGRPSIPFNPDLAKRIWEEIATTPKGMGEVLDELKGEFDVVPSLATIYVWLRDYPEFSEQSARARQLQGDTFADLAVKEALTTRLATITKSTGRGNELIVQDNVQRSQLICQAYWKRAGQLNPKKYGDKLDLNHTASPIESLTEDQLREKLAGLMNDAKSTDRSDPNS